MSKIYFLHLLLSMTLFSCNWEGKSDLNYNQLKSDVLQDHATTLGLSDSSNLFDQDGYNPQRDSLKSYLDSLAAIYEKDSAMVKKMGIKDSDLLDAVILDSSLSNQTDSFNNQLKKINAQELKALKYNLKQLQGADSILHATHQNGLAREESRVWARVSKKKQRLYLYIDGEPVDTFKVSTGMKGYETPTMDRAPSGPTFQKYTSKKFPGGNYKGLGNMPYVVFIRGGYAIHGTTTGNIPRLGSKASHGCIRLHPDNAKIFFELVRKAGLDHTWISIEE